MDIYVYNENLELVGIADSFISLIWLRRYRSAGSFELYAPMTAANVSLLMPRTYIYRPDAGEAMYISGVEDTDDADSGRCIRATGYSVEGILRKRVIKSKTSEAVGLLEAAETVLSETPLAPFGFSDPESLDTFQRSISDGDMGTDLESYMRNGCLLGERDISYRVRLDPAAKRLEMSLYNGRDLSRDIVFSDEWGNLNNMQYAYGEDGCANVIICKCAPASEPDVERDPDYPAIPSYTLGEAEGLDRSERLLMTEPVIKDGVRVVYNEAGVPEFVYFRYLAYYDTLEKMKIEAAAAYSDYTESYSADALGSGYRSKWDIGDVVTVRNDMRGTAYVKRIEEVQEVFDVNGYVVTPTFGEPLKTILDLIGR